jgi:hypothetical protein
MSADINGTAVFFWTSLDVEQAEKRRQKNKLLINAGIHGTSDRCFVFSIARIPVEGNSRYGGGSRRSCQVSLTILRA